MVHTNPAKCRQRIIELLNGQVSAGYGLHLFDPDWFDPEKQKAPAFKSPTIAHAPDRKQMIHGLDHTCSDDALWQVVTICEYVKETGETALFDEVVPFADEGEATVYEHLKRALDFSAEQVGIDGHLQGTACRLERLPQPGRWRERHGLVHAPLGAAGVCRGGGLSGAAFRCCERIPPWPTKCRQACERELWDGEWYLRGITAKGLKVGSNENEEGKVFIESNTWAVVSDAASPERGKSAMDAVDKYLYSPYGIHLLWPAFSKPNDDIGFVGRVYKGIKENAAIFSHPNPWAVIAECKLGRGDRAMKFYDSLLPYNQNDMIEVREAEPYSYCQFVMGKDHTAFGRARHPWLTGSGGWNYTAVTRWILGIRLTFDGLIIDPCVPADWKHFEVDRQWRSATYHIKVENPDGVQRGVQSVTLNGGPVTMPISPQAAGSVNEVVVTMG